LKKEKKYPMIKYHKGKAGVSRGEFEYVSETARKFGNRRPPIGEMSGYWYEDTKWWKHAHGWRFFFENRIRQTTRKAIVNANKSLDKPIGKLVAAVIAGTIVFVLGRYIYERASF